MLVSNHGHFHVKVETLHQGKRECNKGVLQTLWPCSLTLAGIRSIVANCTNKAAAAAATHFLPCQPISFYPRGGH